MVRAIYSSPLLTLRLESLTDIQREEVFFERLEKQKEAEELRKIKRDSRKKGNGNYLSSNFVADA
jgi:hypothetical protein